MADTLKEFSAFSNKKYSDLKAGITLATTSGSEKAVIKNISLKNKNSRPIDITEGSITGPQVATGTTDGFSGNEIMDNSQTLHASTSLGIAATSIHRTGWGQGNRDNSGDAGKLRTHSIGGTKFEGEDLDSIDWGPTDSYSFKNFNTNSTSSISRVSDSWWGADGRFYWVKRGQYGDYKVRRYETNSQVTTIYGSTNDAKIAAWDGSRYFYTAADNATSLRKYDTSTLGTSNTYTTINLYTDGSSSTAQTLSMSSHGSSYYYNDGYILFNGNNDGHSDPTGTTRLISVTTGHTREVFCNGSQNQWWSGGVDSGDKNSQACSLGIVKNTAGEYWAWLGNFGNTNYNSNGNYIWLTNLGKNPENDFLSAAGGAVATKLWYVNSAQISSTNSQYLNFDNSDDSRNLSRRLGVDGRNWGSPAGSAVNSPGVRRYAWLVGDTYNNDSDVDNSNGSSIQVLDFDNALSQQKFVINDFDTNDNSGNYRYRNGTYRMVQEESSADGAFGDIDIRTTGILVT